MGLDSISKKIGAFFHSIIEDPEEKVEEIPTEPADDAMLVRTINLTKKQEGVVDLFKKHEHALELYKSTEISKLQAEIERTEFRKKSLLSVLEYEKTQIEEERRDLFADIGVLTYEMSLSGGKNYDFSNHFSCIKNLEGKNTEKEEKIIEFVKRYDEEIEILQMSIALQETIHSELNPEEKIPVMVICGTCNQTVLDHKFCSNCGSSLSEENRENMIRKPFIEEEINGKKEVEIKITVEKESESKNEISSVSLEKEVTVEEKKEEKTEEKPLEIFPDDKLHQEDTINEDEVIVEVEIEEEDKEESKEEKSVSSNS